MRCEIVWKFVSRPPSQRLLTYGMPAASAASLIGVAGLLLRADEQHGAAAAGDVRRRSSGASLSRRSVFSRSMM